MVQKEWRKLVMKDNDEKLAPVVREANIENPADPNLVVFSSIRELLVDARTSVKKSINFAMVQTYWEIGKQIEVSIGSRSEYGKGLLRFLSENLTREFGKGFTIRNLQTMRQFYLTIPNAHTLCAELSWSHYRRLIRIDNEERRAFYLKECAEQNWSIRQLERQINSFFYERLLNLNQQIVLMVRFIVCGTDWNIKTNLKEMFWRCLKPRQINIF